jgi:hypothetical protein
MLDKITSRFEWCHLRFCCLGLALVLASMGSYAEEQSVTAEQIIAEQQSLSKDRAPFIRLTATGFYVQGRHYDPELLMVAAFVCMMALMVGLIMQDNQAEGAMQARWVRAMPFFLLATMITFCNVCLVILGSKGGENANVFLMAAPGFNIVCALLGIGCIAGITHSGLWLGIMWAGFTLLQMWFLFMIFSNARGDMWIAGAGMTFATAVFFWMPTAVGLWMYRKGELPVSPKSTKR